LAGWKGYRDGAGLIATSHGGKGMFLRHDDGFEQVSPAGLPLGHAATPPGLYSTVMLAQYTDGANDPNRIAVVNGAPAVDIYVGRINPGTGVWAEVAPLPAIPGNNPRGDRECIWDWCVFPFGAPTRDFARYGDAGYTGIAEPCLVFCNANADGPVDSVLVTPVDGSVPSNELFYDHLTRWAADPGSPFAAASCESFNGRVHFLNIVEDAGGGAVTAPYRHRWTGVGTADVDESIVGSGYLDLAEFQKQGRRIESMQNKLALYFEDGAAFQIPTGFYADAYRPQIVSRSRGLLGTQALCAISPHLHFGIFNDGWWTLDSSGRWSEMGRIILEESPGKAWETTKFKNTFYEELDFDYKHRIVCTYDKYRKLVRIAYPSKLETGSENYRILNYHWPTDSCWRDKYGTPTTSWGNWDVQVTAGLTWNAATGTWDTATGTWDSYAAQYQDDVVVHGNGPQLVGSVNGGYVFSRDPSLITYDGQSPNYFYESHELSRNRNPLLSQTFHRFGVEYINIGGSNLQVVVSTNELGEFQFETIPLNEGLPNRLHTGYTPFKIRGTEHGFRLYGTGPVLIRSLIPELMLYGSDDREGQV
jgi:hypothetical protein